MQNILDYGSEMGIKYKRLLNMTWLEYEYESIGYERRLEREWDYTRHLIAATYNSTGMSKKSVKATDIMTLPSIDGAVIATKVRRMSEDKVKSMLGAFNK